MRFKYTIVSLSIRSAIALLMYTACLILLVHTAPLLAEQSLQRIMPLGDSITQGSLESYRRYLWLALKKEDINADFVGSLSQTYGGISYPQDYDVDHEGHWGWRADEVLEHIDEWAASARPELSSLRFELSSCPLHRSH